MMLQVSSELTRAGFLLLSSRTRYCCDGIGRPPAPDGSHVGAGYGRIFRAVQVACAKIAEVGVYTVYMGPISGIGWRLPRKGWVYQSMVIFTVKGNHTTISPHC